MNPVERTETNPVNAHMVRAALEREVAEAHVLPSTHVPAAEVAGAVGVDLTPAPVRHRVSRPRLVVFLTALIVAEVALMVWIWALILGGAR